MPTRREKQLLALEHLEEVMAVFICSNPRPTSQHRQGPTQDYFYPTVSVEELTAGDIRKLPELDVDGVYPFDPDPLFFSPWPSQDEVDFPALVHTAVDERDRGPDQKWTTACTESTCMGGGRCHEYHRMWSSVRRIEWFKASLSPSSYRYTGIIKQTDWHRYQ